MEDSLAVLPSSMGRQPPGQPKKVDPSKFIPRERGGLLLADPKEEACPYTFSDSPAYLRNKQAEEQAKRAAELEGKDETRGFLRSVEELAKKQKWDEAFHIMERRTAVPSGLFLVTRAALRWKFGKYWGALHDAVDALSKYASSAKAGPLAAAFACFARICLGSEPREKESCSKEMRGFVEAWERSERSALGQHVLGQGLFQPRQETRLTEAVEVAAGVEASDGTFVAAPGVRVGYVFLRNTGETMAPLILHFHGSAEVAADYRSQELATKYAGLPAHVLVADYRGYGWSGGEPSLATIFRDAEALAEKVPEILVQHGLPWPYASGLIVSGRSLGAQVAVHVATMFPNLFRGMVLDSAVATSAVGDRLGRAPDREAALACWKRELEKASLDILQSLEADLRGLSALDKIRVFEGPLLVLHGLQDELVPFEGSESLHSAAGGRAKELQLIEGAGHNNIGRFDEYWSALRRFCLKAQLDSSLPSVGAVVEHVCAVCAEKAASKCGRCQKVWYCGRAHQAEHWKTHKATCTGNATAAQERAAMPEGEACVVVFAVANLANPPCVSGFERCLASVMAQETPVHALLISLHCASQPLSDQAKSMLQRFTSQECCQHISVNESAAPKTPFEHTKALLQASAHAIPSHAWIKVVGPDDLWSNRHVRVLLPALRAAAPDPRVVAVSCLRHARPVAAAQDATEAPPADATAAEALVATGLAKLAAAGDAMDLANVAVRAKVARAFVDSTPAPALAHALCAYRFGCKLQAAFGKKVQSLHAPEGEWMRWAGAASSDAPAAPAPSPGDRRRAEEILANFHAGPIEGPGGGPGDGPTAAAAEAARPDADEIARALAALRHRMAQRFVLCAGESISAKEFKASATELARTFLEEAGLHEVIGIERWARETAEVAAQDAARIFQVQVAIAAPN